MRKSMILLVLLAVESFAQEECFQLVETPAVTCIAEDESHVWLGTETDGLIRMNKADNSLEYYDSQNSELPSNEVRSLLLYNNELLIALDTSVYSLTDGVFTSYLDSVSGELALGLSGQLIVAGNLDYREYSNAELTYQQDLFELENFVFSCGVCEYTSDISVDENGVVWISHYGFYEFDLLRFDGSDWTVFDYQNTTMDVLPIESYSKNNRILAGDQIILATSWAGLSAYLDDEWQLLHKPMQTYSIVNESDTMHSFPVAIETDQQIGHWVGGLVNSGAQMLAELAYFNGGSWAIYRPFDDDSSFLVIQASEYDSDLIYAGTTSGLLIIDKSCLPNGLPQLENEEFLIFPNPSSDRIIIEYAGPFSTDVAYSILDDLGRIVLKGRFVHSGQVLDISDLDAGHYELIIRTSNSDSSASFVKQ